MSGATAAFAGNLRELRDHPFDLLRELERRGKVAASGARVDDQGAEEWVGIGFRLGREQFAVRRTEVREVLMLPPSLTRVPGAKSWIRGLANVRGHLLPVVDLRDYLGAGSPGMERSARLLVVSSPDLPVGLVVDEVFGFRRFLDQERDSAVPDTAIRCERFLDGTFRRGGEAWPVFSLGRLLADREFQRAAAD
jgi:twitching motility protein PilI